MKKIIFLLSAFVLSTTQANAVNMLRFHQDEPISFSERGIVFFVFQNGTFDFNTRPNNNSDGYYYRNNGIRTTDVFNNYTENYGVRIEQDNFGRIRRVGNTFINYDFQNRVSRIGTVFMRYNRFALVQVGGLQLVYNRFGELINTFGNVKNIRNIGFSHNVPNYFNNQNNTYYNNNCPNNDFQNIDNQEDENYYYYRNNGTKAKVEDENKINLDQKSGTRS